MSDQNPTTTLAAAPVAPQARSLLKELAEAAGLDPGRYYSMLKEVCGCKEAKDEHFAALMMVAQSVGLNPVMSQMYLVPTQKGVKPVVGVDGYLVFLHRALKDGTIEYHDFEDGWFLNPRVDPSKKELRRGGKVTLKFKNREKPVEHIEWLDEVVRDTGPWKQHQARMLRHKTYAQAIRYHLGLYVPDAEEAGALRSDEPRRVDADVSDSPIAPTIPIPTLGGATPAFAPPPAPLETIIDLNEEGKPDATAGMPGPLAEGGVPQSQGQASSASDAGPAASPPQEFDEAESKRLDAEEAAKQKKSDGSLPWK
jgi:hypothetical protein